MTLLIASMDHSPQEIPNDRNAWHTTVLLISEDCEQWEWGKKLGPLLNSQGKVLQKWAGSRSRRDRYRQAFRSHFPDLLGASKVFAVAFSAQGGAIMDSLPELISTLGLAQNLSISDDSVVVSNLQLGQDLVLSKPQAAYVVYLFSFIARMHALVLLQLEQEANEEIFYCDWQISPDNFPRGSMGDLFSICANSASGLGLVKGSLKVLTFTGSKGDPGSEVCDNLAGMLRQDILRGEASDVNFSDTPRAGHLYWEVHEQIVPDTSFQNPAG